MHSRGLSISCSDTSLWYFTLFLLWRKPEEMWCTCNNSLIQKMTWIFCPGHAGVAGNEHVDKLAGEAAISGSNVPLYPQSFLSIVASHMSNLGDNEFTFSHTL